LRTKRWGYGRIDRPLAAAILKGKRSPGRRPEPQRAAACLWSELAPTVPVRGVIVTSRSADPAFDFVSRFFAPACGVNEDPVTGSAHCCLGPFWQTRLHKTDLLAFQASSRGGVVRVRCRGPRVLLGGQAVTVLRGELV
jgi:predicted PhzF superfamily epimerase YddE/YHI9